jgi:hypothetical protein
VSYPKPDFLNSWDSLMFTGVVPVIYLFVAERAMPLELLNASEVALDII